MRDNLRKYFVEEILPNSARMFGVAAAITGSREDASDAVQTAMLRIWENVCAGTIPDNPTAYCLSAVRNICLTQYIRAKRTVSLDNDEITTTEKNNAEDSLSLREVIGHMRSLPEKERQAVELTAFAGYSSEDIAAELKVTKVNARQLLSRGRRKLRDLFK